jgi:GTP-binding protein Era
LLNALLGQKLGIVSHKPQTTRHSILGINTLENGQIIYLDTPGIHQRPDKARKALSQHLNRTASAGLVDADLVVMLVEALRWTEEDDAVLKLVVESGKRVILAVNKIDRIKEKEGLLPFLQDCAARHGFIEILPISAHKGANVAKLQSLLLPLLPQGESRYAEDELTDRSERFFAAELLREQLTRRYAQEIPYALTVEIESFVDEGDLYRIHALVWVERESQKAILLGKQGLAMKETATAARLQMADFFGKRIFLRVWVKVQESWAQNEASLAALGYGL